MLKPMKMESLHPADIEKQFDENTRLITITHISNSLGSVQPVDEIGKIAEEKEYFIWLMPPNQQVT